MACRRERLHLHSRRIGDRLFDVLNLLKMHREAPAAFSACFMPFPSVGPSDTYRSLWVAPFRGAGPSISRARHGIICQTQKSPKKRIRGKLPGPGQPELSPRPPDGLQRDSGTRSSAGFLHAALLEALLQSLEPKIADPAQDHAAGRTFGHCGFPFLAQLTVLYILQADVVGPVWAGAMGGWGTRNRSTHKLVPFNFLPRLSRVQMAREQARRSAGVVVEETRDLQASLRNNAVLKARKPLGWRLLSSARRVAGMPFQTSNAHFYNMYLHHQHPV
ncbi:hypothetical protein GQ53DRAFT_243004 [Thozetella sp. PMI_491]|nr:hypothetical protein GQ53DRAFT_243004 [Thozetella sp. PMI_491]